MKDYFISLLHKLASRYSVLPLTPKLSEEEGLGFFSELYLNPAFRRFLDAREEYLIHQGMEQLLANNPPNADRAAGQLTEIRNLRDRTKSAYVIMEKRRKEKAPK